jgi:hypothetical protein
MEDSRNEPLWWRESEMLIRGYVFLEIMKTMLLAFSLFPKDAHQLLFTSKVKYLFVSK